MSIRNRLQRKETQFHIELLYGLLFIIGFGYLVFSVDLRIAAFEGGLVVGYLLRIWEKMSIYEQVLEEVVSREAETRVSEEVEQQVSEEVEQQISEEVASEIEEQVTDEVTTELEEQVTEGIATEVEEQIEAEMSGLDEETDERVAERVADVDTANETEDSAP